jgi:hypothetical protein
MYEARLGPGGLHCFGLNMRNMEVWVAANPLILQEFIKNIPGGAPVVGYGGPAVRG